MGEHRSDVTRFTLGGSHLKLSRSVVETRLASVSPDQVRQHAVEVNGVWYPVKQVFEIATGLPRSSFTSHEARRHLAALGFDLQGEIVVRGAPATGVTRPRRPMPSDARSDDSWAREAAVQAMVVSALQAGGWRIVSQADAATKERGVDVIAEHDEMIVGIEVKGYPGRSYADPARAGQPKPTHPSNQAGHWFAQAVLAAMKLRTRKPAWRSVIALPRFPRYESLLSETAGSLAAAAIEVWWVHQDGRIDEP